MYLILPKTRHKAGGGGIIHPTPFSPRNIASVIPQIAVMLVHSITWQITGTIKAGCGLHGTTIPKYSKIMNSMPRNNGWEIVGSLYLLGGGGEGEFIGVTSIFLSKPWYLLRLYDSVWWSIPNSSILEWVIQQYCWQIKKIDSLLAEGEKAHCWVVWHFMGVIC